MENIEIIQLVKQAFELKEQKYYKQAIEILYKALEIENDNVELLYQIGELYYLLSNYDRAMQYLEKVKIKNDNHEKTLKLIYKINKKLNNSGTCLETAETLFEKFPSVENLSNLIGILLELKLFDEIEKYEKSEFFDDCMKIKCANALYKNNEIEKSKYFLSSCDENNPEVLLLQGKMLYDQSEFEKANLIFNRLSTNTQNPDILNYLGLFDLENMNFTDAIKHFSLASNLDKTNPVYFYNLGNAYFYNGWLKEAQQAYSKAIYLAPKNIDFRYSLAYLYYANNDFSKAKNEVLSILELDETHQATLVLKALLLAQDKKFVEAVELLELCIKNNPNDDFAKKSLSSIYLQLSNFDKAQEVLESTSAFKSEDINVLCDLAQIYIQKNEYDDAILLAEKVINMNPNYISAYILGAKASYFKGDYEKTKDYAQKSLSLDINCAGGYYYLALSRQRMNDIEEAVECMKRAILYDLNNPEYYAAMSELYTEKEDYKTALDYMSEAEKLDGTSKYKIKYSELAKQSRKN